VKKPVIILAIDGGGIRGILAGKILARLERILNERSGKLENTIADYFDFFSGTSSGGILTLLYLTPGNHGKVYNATEAVKLYIENGKRVFKKNRDQDIPEKYSSEAIEELFNFYFGEISLDKVIKPCLITSYNIETNSTHFFSSIDAGQSLDYNYFVRDVAMATSAAPGFFTPAHIASFSGTHYSLIDGGVFANNPSLCAYTEVAHVFSKQNEEFSYKDAIIVSIGTGKGDPLFMQTTSDSMEMIIARDSATTDFQMKTLFQSAGYGKHYFRIDPLMGAANNALDDISMDNISRLIDAGDRSVESFDPLLEEIAEVISSLRNT
jgi:patatin-like phospholipase/acyl hydrolase